MAALSDKEFAQQIYDYVGGSKNIVAATNCMTRLRLTVNDPNLVDLEKLKHIVGVLSVLVDGQSFQIIIGPGKVKKVADEFLPIIEANGGFGAESSPTSVTKKEETQDNKPKEKFNIGKWFQRGFKHIGNIFAPMVPGFIAFGVLFGISSIILTAAGGKVENLSGAVKVIYYIFYYIAEGFIVYLAVLTGINTSKEFKVTPAIGATIGGLSILPGLIEISKAIPGWSWGSGTTIKGYIMAGNGGVIAVILAVFLIGYLERWIKSWMPDMLSTVFTPVLTLLIGGVGFLFAIMPLMGFVMKGVTFAVNAMSSPSLHWAIRAVIGFVLGASFLPLVMLGLHRGLDAIYIDFMDKSPTKSTPLYPVFAMADAAQVGAGLAVFLKARKYKHERLKQNALSGIVPQILGVSEPLIYGVTLPMVKPFLTVAIGAGVAGAFINAMGLQCVGFAVSGLMAIPIMTVLNGESNPMGMVVYVAGWAIAVATTFIVSMLLINEKDLNRVSR